MTKTTFQASTPLTTGPYTGLYGWSQTANWNNGVPLSGEDIVVNVNSGVDDIIGLTARNLSIGNAVGLAIQGNLTVNSLNFLGATGLVTVDALNGATSPVTLIVNGITGQGSFNAFTNGTIDIYAPDTGNSYTATSGGEIVFSGTPSSASVLNYNGPNATFAFLTPSAVNTVAIKKLTTSDEIDLPGTVVTSVSYGATSLTITTDAGSYAFTNVTYVQNPTTFSVDANPLNGNARLTGFVGVNFGIAQTFAQTAQTSSGVFAGLYQWSVASNWSNNTLGIQSGDSASVLATLGVEDVKQLSLGNVGVAAAKTLIAVSQDFDVDRLTMGAGAILQVDSTYLVGPAATVIDTNVGASATFKANGDRALLTLKSASDPGDAYQVSNGGEITLSAAPSASSTLSFTGAGAFDFTAAPFATNAHVQNFGAGDSLTVQGSYIINATFGASSLSIQTDVGTYTFNNVTYAFGPRDWTATESRSTANSPTYLQVGLYTPDNFSKTTITNGNYLWSTVANWSSGAPLDGGMGTVNASSTDDISDLQMSKLNLGATGSVVTAQNLEVGNLAITAGATLVADVASPDNSVVRIDNAVGGGGFLEAFGGAELDMMSGVDPGESYFASNGGTVLLAAAPSAASVFDYLGSGGAFVFENPGSTIANTLSNVGAGDSLYLPGSVVESLAFNQAQHQLVVTTDVGTYNFTNVTYNGSNPVDAYSFKSLVNSGGDVLAEIGGGADDISASSILNGYVDITFNEFSGTDDPSLLHDMNGDSNADIVWRRTDDGSVAVWNMDGAKLINGAFVNQTLGLDWQLSGTGDFDGDGKADLLWRYNNAGNPADPLNGQTQIWMMNGGTVASSGAISSQIGTDWSIVGAGDFNGDGKSDLLWEHTGDDQLAVWNMNGAQIQTTGTDFLPVTAGPGWKVVGTGDFNGDGRSDILWQRASDNALVVWEMNGPQLSGADFLDQQYGMSDWSIDGLGDFNHDGRTDILMRQASTGDSVIWFMEGTHVIAGQYLSRQYDSSWVVQGVSDLDNTRGADILWRNSATGQTTDWSMSGATVRSVTALDTQVADPTWQIQKWEISL